MHLEFRINHLALVVRDLAKSAAFYGEVLGLKEIENRTKRPTIRWFAFDGNREIHLISGDGEPAPDRPISEHWCLSTPHFDATLEYLSSKGVRYRNLSGEMNAFNYRGDGVQADVLSGSRQLLDRGLRGASGWDGGVNGRRHEGMSP